MIEKEMERVIKSTCTKSYVYSNNYSYLQDWIDLTLPLSF